MFRPIVFFLITAVFLSSCNQYEPVSASKTVFGLDNRRAMPLRAYPYRAIGLVSVNGEKYCTGTLVGRDLVLTSAHCLTGSKTLNSGSVSFHLGFQNDRQLSGSYVSEIHQGTLFPVKNRAKDWAILRLQIPLGDRYGFLQVEPVAQFRNQSFPVTLAGYSLDFLRKFKTPSVHYNCFVRYSYAGLFRHDCDSDSGASGAPLLIFFGNNTVRIVGIHVTSARCDSEISGPSGRCPKGVAYQHDYANYGISSKAFHGKLKSLSKRR